MAKREEYAVVEAPERAVMRKGKPMKARLLKKWGGNYAGQVLSNVEKGSIPAGVAEFFEDDDPAVNTVVSQESASDPLRVINDEINPEQAKKHNEAQRATADASRARGPAAGDSALEQLEREQTEQRARDADEFAAGREEDAAAQLTAGQREKNAAGKGHGRGENKDSASGKTAKRGRPRKGK